MVSSEVISRLPVKLTLPVQPAVIALNESSSLLPQMPSTYAAGVRTAGAGRAAARRLVAATAPASDKRSC